MRLPFPGLNYYCSFHYMLCFIKYPACAGRGANAARSLLITILRKVKYVSNPRVATWLAYLWVQILQGIVIFISLLDFAIFTSLLIYGTILTIRATRGLEKFFPIMVAVLFLVFRFLYLPFLMLLIPIPNIWHFPKIVFKITFVGLFLLYVIVFLITIMIAASWAIKYRIWRNSGRHEDKVLKRARFRVRKRIRHNRIPQIIVVMPIYNEEPEALINGVKSVVDSIYPSARVTVFLSFDYDQESPLFLHLMKFLTQNPTEEPGRYSNRTVLYYKGVQFVINRFPHGGKRGTQAHTFQQIKQMYSAVESQTYVLFVDSDIILYPDCMIEFVRAMEKGKNLVGMTGFISAISSRERNILLYCQDCEYLTSQVFWRSLEASLGGVTCLPGALTILRLKELSKAAETYFSDLKTENIFDFHRYHLGEDRYLTHLLMEQSRSYSIGFCPSARAKTEAPNTWSSFLKQRRRWLLGAFSNEIYFLSDYRLWMRTPFLLLFKFYDFTARSASSFFIYVVVIQLCSGTNYNWLQLLILFGPVMINWLMLLVFALVLRRFKVFYMFPVMLIVTAWANFFVNVYSIWTWNVRSWGGPRASEIKQDDMLEIVTSTSTKTPVNDTVTLNGDSPLTLRRSSTSKIIVTTHGQSGTTRTSPTSVSPDSIGNMPSPSSSNMDMSRSSSATNVSFEMSNDTLTGVDKPLPPVQFLPPLTLFGNNFSATSSVYSSDWDSDDIDSDDLDSDSEGSFGRSGSLSGSPKLNVYRQPLSGNLTRPGSRYAGGSFSNGSTSSLHIVTLPPAEIDGSFTDNPEPLQSSVSPSDNVPLGMQYATHSRSNSLPGAAVRNPASITPPIQYSPAGIHQRSSISDNRAQPNERPK
ncbi:hypothetical protein RTP6_007488 [Batrachochytrium dendrobatidis]